MHATTLCGGGYTVGVYWPSCGLSFAGSWRLDRPSFPLSPPPSFYPVLRAVVTNEGLSVGSIRLWIGPAAGVDRLGCREDFPRHRRFNGCWKMGVLRRCLHMPTTGQASVGRGGGGKWRQGQQQRQHEQQGGGESDGHGTHWSLIIGRWSLISRPGSNSGPSLKKGGQGVQQRTRTPAHIRKAVPGQTQASVARGCTSSWMPPSLYHPRESRFRQPKGPSPPPPGFCFNFHCGGGSPLAPLPPPVDPPPNALA